MSYDLLAFTLLILLFQNCSPVHEMGEGDFASSLAVCNSSIKSVFVDSIHPNLNACASCHVPGGIGKGGFANSDSDAAFDAFFLTTDERVFDFATNPDHQPGITGSQNEGWVNAAKSEYENAEIQFNTCLQNIGGGDDLLPPSDTTPTKLMVSKTMPVANYPNYSQMTWNLSSEFVNGADAVPGDATLTVEITRYTFTDVSPSLNYYRIRNPVVEAGGQALEIKDIRFHFRGVFYANGTTFRAVDRKVPANQSRSVNPGSGEVTIPVSAFDPNDLLAPILGEVQVTDFAPPTFTQLLGNNGVIGQNCLGCHGNGRQLGGLRMDNYDDLINSGVVTLFNDEASEVIVRMTSATAPMPQSGLLPAAQVDQVRQWIQDGAPDN